MNRFVIVTGLPASGKSTVGRSVAEALGLPLLDKDEILEALFEALGVGDAPWRTRLSRAADQVLQRLALQSNGAVIASWWRHPLSRVSSGTSTDWLSSLPGESSSCIAGAAHKWRRSASSRAGGMPGISTA